MVWSAQHVPHVTVEWWRRALALSRCSFLVRERPRRVPPTCNLHHSQPRYNLLHGVPPPKTHTHNVKHDMCGTKSILNVSDVSYRSTSPWQHPSNQNRRITSKRKTEPRLSSNQTRVTPHPAISSGENRKRSLQVQRWTLNTFLTFKTCYSISVSVSVTSRWKMSVTLTALKSGVLISGFCCVWAVGDRSKVMLTIYSYFCILTLQYINCAYYAKCLDTLSHYAMHFP